MVAELEVEETLHLLLEMLQTTLVVAVVAVVTMVLVKRWTRCSYSESSRWNNSSCSTRILIL